MPGRSLQVQVGMQVGWPMNGILAEAMHSTVASMGKKGG